MDATQDAVVAGRRRYRWDNKPAMGLHDRDYYRETPRGIVLNSQLSAVALMIIINVGVFVVDWLAKHQLARSMALESLVFSKPWNLWQLLTYGFAHSGIMHLLFNMWGLYLFGSDVEAIHGKRRFLEFYLSTIILSGLIWLGCNFLIGDQRLSIVVGASGGVVGLIIVSVLHDPRRTLLFWGAAVPAYVLAMIVVGIDVLRLLSDASGVPDTSHIAYAAHLGGAFMGFVFYTTGWTLASPIQTQFSLKGVKRRINRPKLKIHQPRERDSYDSDDAEENLEAQVDAILAKISEQGQDSLTRKEKKILEAASRKAKERQKHGINN